MSRSELLIERSLELCSIESVTGHEKAISGHLAAALAPIPGWRLHHHGPSLILEPASRADRPLLCLAGHLDTVSPRGENRPRREGDRLYGLGASDMKGGLAILWTLLTHPVVDSRFDLAFLLYASEEGPISQNPMPAILGGHPWLRDTALAVVLEPTDNQLQLGCMGTLHARVTFRGKAAHSARPWQGQNAIHKAGPLLCHLQGMEPLTVRFGPVEYREVISATMALGGHQRNVIPDKMVVNLNYRFGPGRSRTDACRFVEDIVGDAADVAFDEVCPSGPVAHDHPLVEDFLHRCPVPVASKQAWTDVAHFGEAAIPAVNFGPGETAQAHQAGEWLSISALLRGDELLRRFL